MPEWTKYIRQNLHLHGLRPDREAEIIEDLAQQLEDAYREALAGGMAEAAAAAFARQHVPDWDALDRELQRLPLGAAPALERLQESAGAASRSRLWSLLGGLLRDLLFAARMMRRNPGFTLVVVLTLALAIGAASAIFGVVNAVLLRPLPYPNAERLAMIWELGNTRNQAPQTFSVSWQDYRDWRKQVRSIEHLGVFRVQNANLTGVNPPDRLQVSMTSADVFTALGVRPLLGRAFVPEEDEPGAASTVILSETMWRSRFGAAHDILERSITLDGMSYQVVGVMSDSMRFPARVDCWVPLGPFVKNMPPQRGNHPGLTAVARLSPGVTLPAAQAEMDTIAERLAGQYPDSNSFVGVRVRSLYDVAVGGIRTNLLVLFVAVGFVLLIACVNIANLMLARGEIRLREVAVRRALGASRSRLLSQLLTESLVLASCGALLGSGFAWLSLRVLVQSKPAFIPRIDQIGMDAAVLGFTWLVSLAVAALFGLWPALRITSQNAQISLRGSTRTSSARFRLRPFLVAAEAGLATMLLIGASLMIGTFTHLTRIELGFRPDHVLTLRVSLPGQRYPSPDKVSAFYGDLLGRVAALPAVGAAGISSQVPLGGGGAESSIMPQGAPLDPNHPGPGCTFGSVSGGYFQAMGIALLRGRTFDQHDRAGSPPVIVVDETAAQALWAGQDPLGKRVAFEYRGTSVADPQPVWREVVGVVRRVHHYDLTGNSANSGRVQVYVPYMQPPLYSRTLASMALMVRSAGDPAALAASIRHEVSAMDAELPVFLVRTMTEYVDSTLEQPRLSMALLATFGALALLLATVGIYGVLSYSVSQRTREIGIRMALGATRGSVLRGIMREGALISAAGVVVGVAGSLVCMRFIRDLLFGVSPTDLAIYIAIPSVLFAVALCATLIPARRATRVDPIVALRYE
jgi:putative ABC transport system permease protein